MSKLPLQLQSRGMKLAKTIRAAALVATCGLLALAAKAGYLCYTQSDVTCMTAGTCLANCTSKQCYSHGTWWTLRMGTFLTYDVSKSSAVLKENEPGSSRKLNYIPLVCAYRITDPENDCSPNYEDLIWSLPQCSGTMPDPGYSCP